MISSRYIPRLIGISIILASISRVIYNLCGIGTADLLTNIDYFAFGAIPAYILVFKPDFLNTLDRFSLGGKYTVVLFTLALTFLIPNLHAPWLELVSPTIFGILFSMIIFFTLSQKNPFKINDSLWSSRLGIYTYGLYLVHTIVINLFLQIKVAVPIQINWLVFILISLSVTILIIILSYHVFEKQFLKLKKYFY